MIVLSTAENKKIAKEIAKELLKSQAAACVNLIKGVNSTYKWDGKIVKDKEILILIKGDYEQIKDILLKFHSYETPEIIAIKPKKIEKNYKKWLKENIKSLNLLTNTRLENQNDKIKVKFSQALLNPAAKYGGLYAPELLPSLDEKFFKKYEFKNYNKIAKKIIKKFKFDVSQNIFDKAFSKYSKFDSKEPVVIKKIDQNLYINELWHGPTRAFKDMALQPFGSILEGLAKKEDKNYLIICATSGDTGPATLESFSQAKGIKVVCLFPKSGVSDTQRLQMVNAKGKNLKVIGVNGNFDDTQKALKELLNDDEFKSELAKENLYLSAANSVNFGRILFQIIYHIYACIKVTGNKIPLNIIVPSGNFGNALGAYYAKKMGANIYKIKIVSNENNILTELFKTGIYDLRNKHLIQTISPAMDILVSSNVERLLFDKFGGVRTKELMDSLSANGFYELSDKELKELQIDFEAEFCTDNECENFIKEYAKKGILVDPHTATCFKLVDGTRTEIITSTAQWVKFTPSMIKAIKDQPTQNELADMKALSDEFKTTIPSRILELFSQEEIHEDLADKSQIKEKILHWIKE